MSTLLRLFEPAVAGNNIDLASKFIRCIMWQGKKATSQRVFERTLEQIKKLLPDLDPIDVFDQAVENRKPSLELRTKRVAATLVPLPLKVNRVRSESLAIRSIILAARRSAGRPMDVRLAHEILAAYRTWPPPEPPDPYSPAAAYLLAAKYSAAAATR